LLNSDVGRPQTGRTPELVSKNFIPDYQLLRRIGIGAYGEVWLARNILGKLRAIKIIHRSRFIDPRPFEREFEGVQRFEPISRSHPSQLAILHVGKSDTAECFYYVMELADAAPAVSASISTRNIASEPLPETYTPRTLRDELAHGRLPIPDCIQIGLSLTTALAHLHKSGLVHRDIKPSNVLFVNGLPKLGDIGLVTEMGDTQSIVGTEGYIAPEGPGTPQADIFSLGKVLYEISTGMDRRRFPELPEELRQWPDRSSVVEFNEILLKACAKEAERRYQCGDEMRADLELLQLGQSVKQKRIAQRRLCILKKICAVAALLILSVAIPLTFLRAVWFDASNPADRLSKNELANKEYREGVQCCNRDTIEGLIQARDHFNNAIGLEPKFTMAYNGLYEVYIRGEQLGLSSSEASAKRQTYANKLMELDPKLAEAHAAQAFVNFSNRRWDIAEPQFLKAIKLNPKCAMAHNRYGFCLYTAGRPDEALKELQLADMLDPTQPRIKKNIGNVFYVKRQFTNAIAQYEKTIRQHPSYPNAHLHMGCAYRAIKDYRRAIDEFEEYDVLLGKDRAKVKKYFDVHRRAYEQGGPSGYWSKCLEQAQQARNLNWQAVCQANLGNYTQALALIEEACATNDDFLLQSLWWEECWDPLHNDPRFVAVLKTIGLQK
jgi:serine/threonine protein kinase/Tfp pilus assembly protein PilF